MKNTIKNMSLNSSLKHSNKNKTSAFIVSISVACVSILLTACGQSGALYIPNTPEAAQRSTIGNVLTKPASPATPAAPTPATPAPAK